MNDSGSSYTINGTLARRPAPGTGYDLRDGINYTHPAAPRGAEKFHSVPWTSLA
jgi:hypothetical protein